MPKIKIYDYQNVKSKYNMKSFTRDNNEIAKLGKKLNRVARDYKKYGLEQTDEFKQIQQLIKKFGGGSTLPERAGGKLAKLSDFQAYSLYNNMLDIDSSKLNKKTYDLMTDYIMRNNKSITNVTDAKKLLGSTSDNLKSEIWNIQSKLSTMGYGSKGIRELTKMTDNLSSRERAALFINIINAKNDAEKSSFIDKFNSGNISVSRPLDKRKSRKAQSRKMK